VCFAGSLQRLGDNVLATVRAVASSPCLVKPCPEQEPKVIFFDVLGAFVVQYPKSLATPLNYVVCLLVAVKILLSLGLFHKCNQSQVTPLSTKSFSSQTRR